MHTYMIMFRTNEGYLLAHDGQGFHCFHTAEEAASKLPDYDRYHAAGYTWSMSATLYWMTFQPCVVRLEMSDALMDLLTTRVVTISAHCGRVTGAQIKPECHATLDAAIVLDPRLMTKNAQHAKPFYE